VRRAVGANVFPPFFGLVRLSDQTPMTVAVPVLLNPEERAALEAQAKAQHMSVDFLLRKTVFRVFSRKRVSEPPLTVEEFQPTSVEMADLNRDSDDLLPAYLQNRGDSRHARP
jgi:hypothetical protein